MTDCDKAFEEEGYFYDKENQDCFDVLCGYERCWNSHVEPLMRRNKILAGLIPRDVMDKMVSDYFEKEDIRLGKLE